MQEVKIMLIQFRFKNYKSFRDETIFDMSATSQREHNDFLIEKNGNKLLPVAAIFGGNANGKSNFIEAFFNMMYCIVSTYDFFREEELPVEPYIFNKNIEPTAFEVTIAINNTEYKYGFALDEEKIYQEWLMQRPFKKTSVADYKKLFEREGNEITLYNEFKEYEQLKFLVKEKNLFFSILGRRGEGITREIYDWVINFNFEMDYGDMEQYILKDLYEDEELFEQIKREIKEVDPCIQDMIITEEISKISNKEFYELETIHKISGEEFNCPFVIESEGTKKLFCLYYNIYDALYNGGVLFVDELDSKLHSLVLKHIINLFNNKETNPNNAQIVFTCHNTWCLDRKILRRDQIWFITKEKDCASKIYALSDFKDVRSDLDYNKAYLSGKFGAIPYTERSTNGN